MLILFTVPKITWWGSSTDDYPDQEHVQTLVTTSIYQFKQINLQVFFCSSMSCKCLYLSLSRPFMFVFNFQVLNYDQRKNWWSSASAQSWLQWSSYGWWRSSDKLNRRFTPAQRSSSLTRGTLAIYINTHKHLRDAHPKPPPKNKGSEYCANSHNLKSRAIFLQNNWSWKS